MQKINLTNGGYSLVDDEDYPELVKYNWYRKTDGYASRIASRLSIGPRSTVRMHRTIMNVSDSRQVDHINGNRLDNRKSNLRICTLQQNRMNTGLRSSNSTGYKGVSVNRITPRSKPWRARIRNRQIGCYHTKEEAAIAYNAEAVKEYGEFARLNIIREVK